ncbi:N-acetylneuraminate synthase family protein [Halobacillus amylolyticus]|uniref:N-acetylneuraminate synthase family protein n=1 Tax=Halobacillus amylolyticus TaxID=2932259 RepID=A0ABY4H8X2_9BACI|nr:N-acetylneuraminate synthase family protein [Halobacillus amylolyticus]UOR11319.1 N-acetylneuraminate synthase family protein [Halobacillus amylolyticus]
MKSQIIERALGGKFVLIAEIGVNYYDIAKKLNITPMEAAKLMVKKAKKVGIHAVKFQTYKAETLAAKNSPSYWDTSEEPTTSQYELFKKFDSFTYNEYKELYDYCNDLGIEFLSTAFDVESVDYLYDLMGVFKISSSDLNNLPFVEYQAKKGKPILLSVGASGEEEIAETIQVIRKHNNEPIVLLHCVLEYPTPYEHANLNRILTLKNKYPNVIIGYSDHTKPDEDADVIKTAYNLGALVIEKHFTLDKSLPGNDHYHAMDTEDASKIINGIDFTNSIRGSYDIKCLDTELTSRRNARRSLVAKCDIEKGVTINSKMLTFKRPGTGISPAEINKVVGKVSKETIREDSIIQFKMIEE